MVVARAHVGSQELFLWGVAFLFALFSLLTTHLTGVVTLSAADADRAAASSTALDVAAVLPAAEATVQDRRTDRAGDERRPPPPEGNTFMGMLTEQQQQQQRKDELRKASSRERTDESVREHKGPAQSPPLSSSPDDDDDDDDCLSLVGPWTRTFGGVDQPRIRGRLAAEQNRSLELPSDGVIRDFTQHMEVSCKIFYRRRRRQHHQRHSSGGNAATQLADGTVITEEDGDDVEAAAGRDGPKGFVFFPRRYKAMDKQSRADALPTREARAASASEVSHFDLLLGLPETAQVSPLRRHRQLFFLQTAAEEASAAPSAAASPSKQTASVESESDERSFPSTVARAYAVLSEQLSHAWGALSRYPLHNLQALQRLFAVRTLRVSFPLLERHRRLSDDDAARAASAATSPSLSHLDRSRGGDGGADADELAAGGGEADEMEEEALVDTFLTSPASRAALLSEGSLSKVRVISFPPVPRRYRVERAVSPPGSPTRGAATAVTTEERFVCDFKAVLQAAAHVRAVEQELQRLAEEEERVRRLRERGHFTAEDAEDDDGDDGFAYGGGAADSDEGLQSRLRQRMRQMESTRTSAQGASASSRSRFSAVFSASPAASGAGGRRVTEPLTDGLPARPVPHMHQGGGGGGRLSVFSLYAWVCRGLAVLLFPRSRWWGRGEGGGGGAAAGATSSSVFSLSSHAAPQQLQPPPSYELAKAYMALVTEELGPFQPTAFSFSSDYVRYLLGRRPLYTSQRLLHVEDVVAAASHRSTTNVRSTAEATTPILRTRELFVWRASLPATETMCLGFIALPPPASALASYHLPLDLHEELVFDWVWCKALFALLVFHVVVVRMRVENSRVCTFLFAALCGFLTLLVVLVFYVLKEIQKMSVGRMGLYAVLLFGGLAAFLDGLLSAATMTVQQLFDALDAQESGVSLLSLFSLSPWSLLSPRTPPSSGDDAIDELIQERQSTARTVVLVILCMTLLLGLVSSLLVRCFISERYLRIGTRLSLRVLLVMSWLAVFAVNREATSISLVVYVLVLRPGAVLRLLRWLARGRPAGRAATETASSRGEDAASPSRGRVYNETDYEPTDDIPEAARRLVSHYTPLAREGTTSYLGSERAATSRSSAERMKKYEEDGAAFTRKALDELAKTIRANPGKYASRLRDPSGVQRWAGNADDDDDSNED